MSDKMREAFEKWAKSGSYNMKRTHDGLYIYPDTASAWHAWQAAHAAALPPGFVAVPVEPTDEMIDAGRWMEFRDEGDTALSAVENDAVEGVWSHMLSAAPKKEGECVHRFMYFGDQPNRRCADCNAIEGATP